MDGSSLMLMLNPVHFSWMLCRLIFFLKSVMFSPTRFSMLIMCCFPTGDEMEPDVEEDEYDEDGISNLVVTYHSLHGFRRLYFSQKFVD